MLDFADFVFDAAVVAAAFLWTPMVLTERCAELAEAVFPGAFFAADVFFSEAEAAGLAVFLAVDAGEVAIAPEAAEGCASRPFAGHSRHVKTTATRNIVLRSGIAFRSNYSLPIEITTGDAGLHRNPSSLHFNCKPRCALLARQAPTRTT
jgi:hypothetical protein